MQRFAMIIVVATMSIGFFFWFNTINLVGQAVDFFRHGSREATTLDYPGIPEIDDFRERVLVYDNYVEVLLGDIEERILMDGAYILRIPTQSYRYADYNEDGVVDEFEIDNDQENMHVLSIHSRQVWDTIYVPHLPHFNDSQKVAGDALQQQINADYQSLREKGDARRGKAHPPGGTWFDEYPVKMKR